MEMEWMTLSGRGGGSEALLWDMGEEFGDRMDYAASQCTNGWMNVGDDDDDDDTCCLGKPKRKLPKGLIRAAGKTKNKPGQAGKSRELRKGACAFFSNLLY